MFAVAVVAAGEIDDDRHDFTERQRRLAGALALAALEQVPPVERLEPLAKVVDSAEHGNELAHRDLHMVQAAFRDTATIRRSLWAGKTLPLIPNSGFLNYFIAIYLIVTGLIGLRALRAIGGP